MSIFNYSRFIVLCQVVILSEAFVQTRWRGRAHLEINQPKKELVLHSSRSVEDLRVNAASALLGLQLVFGVGLPFTSTPINVPIARAGEEAVSSRDATADEAWRLLDKFYLDKNFNGQDWAKVREEASARARKEGSQSAIQAMTSGLGDKYTRYVDAKSYEALSRFDMEIILCLIQNSPPPLSVGLLRTSIRDGRPVGNRYPSYRSKSPRKTRQFTF